MGRTSRTVAVLFSILALTCGAQTAKTKVTCASCHATQANFQPQTLMGRALQLPENDLILKASPRLTVQKGAFTYTVERRGNESTYSVTDGTRTISLPLHWNFGAANQTWVLERDGHYYESLVSYYVAIRGLDTTTGDEKLTPKTLEEAVGREITENDAKACFGCHATSAVTEGKLNLSGLHPGLGCEHCHLNANQHMFDAFKGVTTTVPKDLGDLTAGEQANFCGQCHRTWEMAVRSHWHGEADVRFQPYRLENSRCFNAKDPRIGCLACHDPHESVSHDPSFYDDKCLSCHAKSLKQTISYPAAAGNAPTAKACPVSTSKCVTCHMPKVQMLGGHLTFTDHEIRVVKPGDPYPN